MKKVILVAIAVGAFIILSTGLASYYLMDYSMHASDILWKANRIVRGVFAAAVIIALLNHKEWNL